MLRKMVIEDNIHFIGIGGVGVSALAKIMLESGHKISGSDKENNSYIENLRKLGARIKIGHSIENLPEQTDLVVTSSAIPQDNPEIIAAKSKNIKILKRSELLGIICDQFQCIAVAGTHGKTTTSSMIAHILREVKLDPTFLIGGTPLDINTNSGKGQGLYLVTEADEYDSSFLKIKPWISVITNIEADHLDHYKNIYNIKKAFQSFMENVNANGYIVVYGDDPIINEIAKENSYFSIIKYGLSENSDLRAININNTENSYTLTGGLKKDQQI